MPVQIKRVYEPASSNDGDRVLIDRLWPRGVSRQNAKLDEWVKELAPSRELRQWFGHEPARFHLCGAERGPASSPSSTRPVTPITTTPSSSPRS
jgi:uncharacterized protein YeaO (DUF488 family)